MHVLRTGRPFHLREGKGVQTFFPPFSPLFVSLWCIFSIEERGVLHCHDIGKYGISLKELGLVY